MVIRSELILTLVLFAVIGYEAKCSIRDMHVESEIGLIVSNMGVDCHLFHQYFDGDLPLLLVETCMQK